MLPRLQLPTVRGGAGAGAGVGVGVGVGDKNKSTWDSRTGTMVRTRGLTLGWSEVHGWGEDGREGS